MFFGKIFIRAFSAFFTLYFHISPLSFPPSTHHIIFWAQNTKHSEKEKSGWKIKLNENEEERIHRKFYLFSRVTNTHHALQPIHNGCCPGEVPGSNRKLFSAEIAERRNWTLTRARGGGRVRRGDWLSREERHSRRRADSAPYGAAPLRFLLASRTCRRPRIQGAPPDHLPISLRRLSLSLVHHQVSHGDW